MAPATLPYPTLRMTMYRPSPAPHAPQVRMHAGACHNELRPGAGHARCPVATFLWGGRDAWRAFNARYLERVRELVTAAP